MGKAILAFLPRAGDAAAAWKERPARAADPPRTMTNVEDLLADLDRTVERRYSTDDEESNPEVCCLGVPIRNEHGDVIAGMSVSVHRSPDGAGVPRQQLARLPAAGAAAVPPHGATCRCCLPVARRSWPPEPLLQRAHHPG